MAVLSSVLLASLESARLKTRAIMRIQNLVQVRNALEVYASSHNGMYPSTGGNYRSECNYWSTPADQVIPGLIPNYIAVLPRDAKMNNPTDRSYCYVYKSNPEGSLYKFMAYHMHEQENGIYATMPEFVNPHGPNDMWMVTNKKEAPSLISPYTTLCTGMVAGDSEPEKNLHNWPYCW